MSSDERSLTMTDHDLLVVIHTKLERALIDMASYGPTLTQLQEIKIDKAEAYKLLADAMASFKAILDDHESRVRALEKGQGELLKAISNLLTKIATWGTIGLTILGIAEVALQVYFR